MRQSLHGIRRGRAQLGLSLPNIPSHFRTPHLGRKQQRRRLFDQEANGNVLATKGLPSVSNPSLPGKGSIHAKQRILRELEQCDDPFYSLNETLKPAVQELIASNPSTSTGPDSMTLGQGKWQVFHAPHIVNLSSSFGVRFDPIWYRLDGNKLFSNVKYAHPVLGSGWLSASGTMSAFSHDTVNVHFDKFWVDVGAANLREQLTESEGAGIDAMGMLRGEYLQNVDALIGTLGRSAFFPQLASFPVQYVDGDLAVFKFPPLDSLIAVKKVDLATTD